MAEITEEQFQALNDQADAEAALKAKLEEENVALGEEIAALEADLAVLKAASADADGTKAALRRLLMLFPLRTFLVACCATQ